MISHAAVTVSSLENLQEFFEQVMQFQFLYKYGIDRKAAQEIFGISIPTEVYVYRSDQDWIEVFINRDYQHSPQSFNHICFRITDLPGVVLRGEDKGYKFTRYRKQDHTILFIIDKDGNYYELKKANNSE
ncbi:MAG: hypothetical protein APR63_07275 [Desulfuromonas sp. SDB]|nr:MAG: hypothetical protein APR63_07275 [Desulfuromonas sp. SDB]